MNDSENESLVCDEVNIRNLPQPPSNEKLVHKSSTLSNIHEKCQKN